MEASGVPFGATARAAFGAAFVDVVDAARRRRLGP